MPTRRQWLSLVAVSATGSIAGCQEVLEGGEIDAVAEPAQAGPDAVSQTGFGHLGTESQAIEGNVTVIEGEWDINITWWTAAYGTHETDVQEQMKEGDIDPPEGSERVFLIMSSPDAEYEGTKFNPVRDYTTEDITTLAPIGDDNTEIESVENIDEAEVTILEQETTADVFRATLTQTADGTSQNETEISPHNETSKIPTSEESDVIITTSRVNHKDDILFFIGYYAEGAGGKGPDLETQERFLTLIESVEHPTELDSGQEDPSSFQNSSQINSSST